MTESEHLNEAKEELKRADHLIYVSLKYTRTVDVIRNIIDRLINAFDFGLLYALEEKEEQGVISEIPQSVAEKVDLAKKFIESENVEEILDFYLFLRLLMRADFTRQREFRRHVTMSSFVQGRGVVEVTIDVIHEYYEKTKEFVKMLEGSEE